MLPRKRHNQATSPRAKPNLERIPTSRPSGPVPLLLFVRLLREGPQVFQQLRCRAAPCPRLRRGNAVQHPNPVGAGGQEREARREAAPVVGGSAAVLVVRRWSDERGQTRLWGGMGTTLAADEKTYRVPCVCVVVEV